MLSSKFKTPPECPIDLDLELLICHLFRISNLVLSICLSWYFLHNVSALVEGPDVEIDNGGDFS